MIATAATGTLLVLPFTTPLYLNAALSAAQVLIGLAILITGLILLSTSVDHSTRAAVCWPLVGLVAWAAWFTLQPLARGPDSPPAIALAGLVAYVLARHRIVILCVLNLRTKEPS